MFEVVGNPRSTSYSSINPLLLVVVISPAAVLLLCGVHNTFKNMRHVVEAMPTKFELGRRRNICSTTHCKHDVAIAAPNNANPASERIKENNKTQINIKPTYPFNCLEHFDPSCLRKSALPSLRIQFRNVITRQHTTKTILGRLRNSQLVDRLSKDFRQQRRPIIQWHRRSLPIILCSRFQIVLLFKRQHRHLTQQIQISAAVILRQIRSHFVDANRQPVIKIYIYVYIWVDHLTLDDFPMNTSI